MLRASATREDGKAARSAPALVTAALAAPFLLALPQGLLVPTWYSASLYLAGVLLFLHTAAGIVVVVRCLRRRAWSWPARLTASLGILLVVGAAAVVTWAGADRGGSFLCGRELVETMSCADGGQAFAFASLCIAGNPKTEVTVRPSVLPFMYPVSQGSAADACAALRR